MCLSVYAGDTLVSRAKRIKMLFGTLTRVGLKNHVINGGGGGEYWCYLKSRAHVHRGRDFQLIIQNNSCPHTVGPVISYITLQQQRAHQDTSHTLILVILQQPELWSLSYSTLLLKLKFLTKRPLRDMTGMMKPSFSYSVTLRYTDDVIVCL